MTITYGLVTTKATVVGYKLLYYKIYFEPVPKSSGTVTKYVMRFLLGLIIKLVCFVGFLLIDFRNLRAVNITYNVQNFIPSLFFIGSVLDISSSLYYMLRKIRATVVHGFSISFLGSLGTKNHLWKTI